MATQNPTHQLVAGGSDPQSYDRSRLDTFDRKIIHFGLRQRFAYQHYARDNYSRWCSVPETLNAQVESEMMSLQEGLKRRYLDVVLVGEEPETPYQRPVKRW